MARGGQFTWRLTQPSQATVRDGLLGNLTDAEPGTPAGDHPVMEFPQTMPDDDLTVADGARLDPLTCELTTAYVSAIAN